MAVIDVSLACAGRAQTPSIQQWQLFTGETFTPLALVAGGFNAGVSQASNSDPRYGVGGAAYAERFGASTADLVTQNFFSDYVMASVLHEDTRYRRRGEGYGFWSRVGYAISRAYVTRNDEDGNTVNWSNFVGTAMSAALSNTYYPPASRTAEAAVLHWGTSVSGAGFGNLLPEFLPDFKAWLKRHHL
jgi:hypothetical protein